MTEREERPAPPEIDVTVAHPARVYDYLLGGKDNYASDRVVAEELMAALPGTRESARSNRDFVLRAVRYVVGELGIDQVVDVGTGIPTTPAVHEVAQSITPGAIVGYVDNDPIVLAHDRALLGSVPGVLTVLGDLTDPASVLQNPELTAHVDWSRPVALIVAAVFHFVPDAMRPLEIMAAYRDRLVPGSALVLSHVTSTDREAEQTSNAEAAYTTAAQRLVLRSRAEIAEFFTGTRLVDPGLVHFHDWRPTDLTRSNAGSRLGLCGVGVLERRS